jgi:hypothetical protein
VVIFLLIRGNREMDKNKKGMNITALLLMATTVIQTGEAIMEAQAGMDTIDVIKQIIDVGITPVLLLVFVFYFINKSKTDDKRVEDANQNASSKIDETLKASREHEESMLAESAKREEMLRQEAERRENMLRKEAEKRESILMLNMEKITDSMTSMTKTMDRMESAFSGIEKRLENIEYKIEEGAVGGSGKNN